MTTNNQGITPKHLRNIGNLTDPTNNQTTDQAIRAVFEKHTMPEAGDPDLTMFDTDAVINDLSQLLANEVRKAETRARKQAASDIFNLAHEYASEDKTMVGSENLRNYHYYNAIAKIGEFDGR